MIALLLDAGEHVLAANAAARAYFGIHPEQLPAGLVEVTREGNLSQQLRLGTPEGETRLVHRRRAVKTRVAPGPRPGDSLLFITDVSDLRRLETVRQEFVANLAHDLRTPLTSLRLAVESLEGAEGGPREKLLARAIKETDHLTATVDNLRQLTEIESGGLTVELSRFAVAGLLKEIAERAEQRRLLVEAPPELELESDRSKLVQALSNLVDNAAKFSPPEAAIEVSAEQVEGEVRIHVRDHGPGISPEHWERVFERFYKVDPARSREGSGTGLGLAITKHLVMALGGRVWTESAADGGQVFSVALPASLTAT